jgi:hypothetical protein
MDFIYEIENAAPKELCELIIECFLKDHKKHPASIIGDNIVSDLRKSTNTWILENPNIWGNILPVITEILCRGIQKYREHLQNSKYITDETLHILFDHISLEPPFVNRMSEGEYYKWHVDNNVKGLKSDKIRTFTCLLYLNTLEENQGGCTEFMCGKKVRPEQGKLLIFPSSWTYEHQGAEVKNGGVKYTCGTWVC